MISIKNLLVRHKDTIIINAVVIWTFLILTILLLYSCPVDFLNQIPGDGGDGYQFMWDLWWVKYSTTELGRSPYVTNYIFYPDGHSLLFHSLIPLAGIITIPFQDSLGLFFSYNFILILSYVSGGFGAYLLAKYFTKNIYASYLAGIIFTFSPYHLGHTLGHLNLISLGSIPFYILFLFKLRDTSDLKYAFGAALFLLTATFLGSFYYTFILVMFTGFFILYKILYDILLKRKIDFNRKFICGLVLIPAIFLLISGTVTIPMLYESSSEDNPYAERSLINQIDNSADLVNFLIPGSDNYFFGKDVENIEHDFDIIEHDFDIKLGGAENRVYIGYTVIGFLAFSFYKYRNKMRKHISWVLLTGTFIVLSLGPRLKILGNTTFTQSDATITLPGSLIRDLPVGTMFQSPSRFAVITYLGLGLLAAFGMKYIIENVKIVRKHKILPILLIVVISSLILMEYNTSLYTSRYDSYVPQIYYQLNEMDDDFSVLVLPAHDSLIGRYMYYSTVSEKPLVDGYVSRMDLDKKQRIHDIPIVKLTTHLFEDSSLSSDVFLALTDESNTQNSFQELERLDVRFIILHKQFFDNTAASEATGYLIETVGAPFYADYYTVVFKLVY